MTSTVHLESRVSLITSNAWTASPRLQLQSRELLWLAEHALNQPSTVAVRKNYWCPRSVLDRVAGAQRCGIGIADALAQLFGDLLSL
jgi:hypothetical protein